MIKTTLKSVALSLVIVSMVVFVLVAVDNAASTKTSQTATYLRVSVVDLDNKPVHNAKVKVCGQSYFTDNKGLSPIIELSQLSNCYDQSITEWFTVSVAIEKQGYVPTAVFNCVVYDSQTRKLTVKIYPLDGSELPYVCYVESPPESYVLQVLK